MAFKDLMNHCLLFSAYQGSLLGELIFSFPTSFAWCVGVGLCLCLFCYRSLLLASESTFLAKLCLLCWLDSCNLRGPRLSYLSPLGWAVQQHKVTVLYFSLAFQLFFAFPVCIFSSGTTSPSFWEMLHSTCSANSLSHSLVCCVAEREPSPLSILQDLKIVAMIAFISSWI